jgi:hypothetical protein
MNRKQVISPALFLFALFSASLIAAGCAPTRFNTDAHFDTTYDFTSVQTYAFDPRREKVATSKSGQLMQEAIRKQLTSRGYGEVSKSRADVLISYDVGVYASAQLSGRANLGKVEGGVSIWIYDSKTGENVWYGWAERIISDQDTAEGAINDAVTAIFKDQLPNAHRSSGAE